MSTKANSASDRRVDFAALARELPAIAHYIRQGRCALFVGAGLSKGAGYPLWPELIQALIQRTVSELGIIQRPGSRSQPGTDAVDAQWRKEFEAERKVITRTATELRRLARAQRLLEVADQCRALLGPGRFATLLRELLPRNASPTAAHRSIVATPYAFVITTNFDTLIEDAYAAWGKWGRPKAPTGMELANHGTLLLDRKFFVLKAHGTLEDSASLVFTLDDYRRISFATPAFAAMLSAIFLTHAILFVGYSLGDPNFRLLFDAQLTTFGTDVPPRYAIMEGVARVERELLWRTARIRTIEYPQGRHELVPKMLHHLALVAEDRGVRLTSSGSMTKRSSRDLLASPLPARRLLTPQRSEEVLYVRIAARGIRLDVSWTDQASQANAWRDADAGLETTVGAARLLPFAELHDVMATNARSGRPPLLAVGKLLAAVLPPALINAFAQMAPGAEVVLSLSAESEALPWEWLLIDGTPLAERNAVIRAPVLASDWSRGRVFASEPLHALIIGDPGSGHAAGQRLPPELRRDAHPLPGAHREAGQLAKLLRRIPGASVRLLHGADATYENVMGEVRTGDYDIIHFAGHAWFDERESYLALHDGRVWVSELGSLLHRRPPALMMFNSHFTAFVPLFSRIHLPGEAPPRTIHDYLTRALGRSRGFTHFANRVGVTEYIACMGEPDDGTAERFAIDMYTALVSERVTVAQAVLRARRAVVDPGDVTRLLYTHSGYGDTTLRS